MEEDNKANIIDLQEKRRAQRQRRKLGRNPNIKPKKKGPGGRPHWLAYIQFFALLALVAWLVRQC